MSKGILLVSRDLTVIHEVESIVKFLEYELTVIDGTRELYRKEAGGDYLLALLHLESSRDLQEAIDQLSGDKSKTALYTLQLEESDTGAVLPPGLRGFIKYPIKYRNLLGTIRDAEAALLGTSPRGGLSRELTGVSPALQEIQALSNQVAKTDAIVLLLGESGTGKEVVARTIHQQSLRSDKPFVAVNCGAIPGELLESELFGHEKGAFTGAISSRRGRFELAEGGTLFLDEIGELPSHVQARLQQVLEVGTIHELDTGDAHHVDVRLLSATHRDLKQLIDNNLFREDLYYRINVVTLQIPPLRERGDDILRIAEVFLQQTTKKLARQCGGLSPSARQAMLAYDWPGNVRELENAIERAVILCNEGEIDEELLAIEVSAARIDPLLNKPADQTSLEDYFVRFVTDHQDQLTETELAQKLGISRKSLWERRQRLDIPRKRTKKRGPRRDNA